MSAIFDKSGDGVRVEVVRVRFHGKDQLRLHLFDTDANELVFTRHYPCERIDFVLKYAASCVEDHIVFSDSVG
jgi:hypothetical protein